MPISGLTLKPWADPYDLSNATEGSDLTSSNPELITINNTEEPYLQHPLAVTVCKENIQTENPEGTVNSVKSPPQMKPLHPSP